MLCTTIQNLTAICACVGVDEQRAQVTIRVRMRELQFCIAHVMRNMYSFDLKR